MLRRALLLLILAAVAALAQAQVSAPPPPEPQKQVKTYTLPPEKLARAIDYAHARNWLHFIGFAYSVAVLAGLLACKVAPRFRNWAQAASRRRIVQAYIFAPLLLLAVDGGVDPIRGDPAQRAALVVLLLAGRHPHRGVPDVHRAGGD